MSGRRCPFLLCAALALPPAADATSAADVLRAALQARFAEVTRWDIAPSKGFQSKRRPVEFAQEEGMQILRDGRNFFVKPSQQARAEKFRVAGFRPVAVAARRLQQRDALTESDIEFNEREIFGLGCEPLNAGAQIGSVRLRRDMRAGDALCREDLEPRPAVAKNELITVYCMQGPVQISATAQAISDAELGARVRVKRPGAQHKLTARVTGRGEVDACI